jgi:hypothetical protein
VAKRTRQAQAPRRRTRRLHDHAPLPARDTRARSIERGYVIVVAEPASRTGQFRVMDTVMQPASTASTAAAFVVEQGVPGAHRA